MGFNNVYNLAGGIEAWEGLKAVGPQEMNLEHLRGDETPEEIVFLAYGMEKGLQSFYLNMKEKKEDREMRDLFAKLAGIEEKHKRMLFELQAEIGSDRKSIEAFEADAGPAILEGGFDMRELMDRNESLLKTVRDVIDLAMMLETQALDLYLRFAEKGTNRKTKKVLLRIADEEKGHLSALGRLLEEKL
jgi:rubrerythrin